MENYDRQQDGGNFGEVREDVFADPFDGEAVSEDAGSGGDWGRGLLDWDSPQEEQQQEQGYVEGEYDPGSGYDPGFVPEGEYAPGSEYDSGFVPEGGYDPGSEYDTGSDYDTDSEYDTGFVPQGEYTPGSDYDPGFLPESGDGPEGGYDPLFTWGGFEDDVMAEEPVDTSAADPWGGGTQPLETVGGADAAGDPEIEMYSEDAGQAGVDAGVDENVIEMLPDEAGEAGTDAKDGGMEEIEFTPEEAAAVPAQPDDAGDGEIELAPEYVGRSDWHKVADKFEEKFGEDELMLQMKFRQIAEDNPDLRVALKNVFGWEDTSRSDWQKVLDKFEEKFPEDELKQHIEFRQTLEDNPSLREVAKNMFGYDHPGKDVEIEMPPEDVGQVGADTGVDENDIEMLPGDGEIEMLP